MSDQTSRGFVLAGRYRIGDPVVDDIPSATTYAATDIILDRQVRVRLLSGSRTGALDAARRAALVTDSRLVRVLDVGTLPNGQGYVVSEQVAGPSLAELLAQGPLSADQARAVAGEAAGAIEVARRRGVHHLTLRPSVVHISRDGRVVLSGLAIDAALLGRAQNDDIASRTDALDLVRLLYAGFTGSWPASAETAATFAMRAAPADANGVPLPPRAVNPQVPADLSALCAAALTSDNDGPRAAGDVVRALEPWGEIRVADPSDEPDAARPDSAGAVPAGALGSTYPPQVPRQSVRAAFGQERPLARPGTPPPAAQHRPAPVAAPAVPAGARAPSGRGPTTDPTPVVGRTTYGDQRRFAPTRIVLAAVAVALLVALVLAVASLFSNTHRPPAAAAATSSTPTSTPTTTASHRPTASPSPTTSSSGGVPLITGLTTYDPVDTAGEHPELTGRALDQNPATTWNTRTYKNAAFGGLKPGVALIVTLSGSSTVHTVTLATTGTGGAVEIRKVDPANPQGGQDLASGPLNHTTTFTLEPNLRGTTFVVWISQLPTAADGSFRLELSEITVG